jgi:hypothetical protein
MMKGDTTMKGNLKRILTLALLAVLLAASALPLPGLPPAARAEEDFVIENGILIKYNGPGGVVRIPHGVTAIGEGVFKNRDDITGVVIPKTVTKIGNRAFMGCTGLVAAAIPNTVEVIGEYAFHSCRSLKKVVLPKGVTKIGNYAFQYCDGLKSLTIPKGVTEMGEYAFGYCDGLKSVTFQKGFTEIGENAFACCNNLKKVTLPKSIKVIGDRAFSNCKSLTDIALPKGVETIGSGAFVACRSLKKVTIPDAVEAIMDNTFADCTGLTSVKIGSGVTKIWEYAFNRCASLTNVVLPASLTSIAPGAFWDCTGLTSVVIPDSVTDIAEDAFDGCTNLRFVTLPSEAPAPGFAGSDPKTIVIPDNLIPPMIVLRERQSMVLPRFRGAKVTWSVADPTVAAVVKNRTVRGLRGDDEDTTLTLEVKQAAQGKALTLNGQPLKPGEKYHIALKVVGKGEATVRKVAINGPGKLTLHPLGPEHGYPATAALDLAFTPAAFHGIEEWKKNCFYISSNPRVAQVAMDEETGEGKIFAIRPGKAVITAYTPNMKTAKVTVTVKGRVTSLKLKDGDGNEVKRLTLNQNSVYQLTPEFNVDAAFTALRWTSSKPAVAYVDGNGDVNALSTGTARITAMALDGNNKKATVIVTVTEAD